MKKKEEYLSHFYKGRKPMYKWILEKKTGERKVVVEEKVDDDDKYFQEHYQLGSDNLKTHGHLEGSLKTNW